MELPRQQLGKAEQILSVGVALLCALSQLLYIGRALRLAGIEVEELDECVPMVRATLLDQQTVRRCCPIPECFGSGKSGIRRQAPRTQSSLGCA